MNLFKKQFQHKFIFTISLVLLLVGAIAFCSIGFSTYVTIQRQMHRVDSQYTTVAIPSGNMTDYYGFFYDGEDVLPLVEQTRREYPGLLAEDARGFLGAHVSDYESLSVYDMDNFNSPYFDAYNHSMMVLAVRCISVEDITSDEPESKAVFDDKDEIIGWEEFINKYYGATFTLEEAVCRMSGYEIFPDNMTIHMSSHLYTPEGEIPFEPGKTYLLFGMDRGSSDTFGITKNDAAENREGRWQFPEPFGIWFATDEVFGEGIRRHKYDRYTGNMFLSWKDVAIDEETRYHTLTEDSMPFYAEYTGDWREFLESEKGKVWREKVLPFCQLNYESVGVILTDSIDSMLLFNNGNADILDGRKFEPQEYNQGDAVCMVSGAYAAKNNLSVGDTIQLDFYRADMTYQMDVVGAFAAERSPVPVQEPCIEENRIGVEKEYTIVGIYTAPEFTEGWHNFQADTIFVPKASVPDAEKYEDWYNPLLYSIILENGREEEFEEALEEIGYGGLFAYYDQNYNTLAKSFEALSANAMRLAMAGLAVFVLAGILFLFLIFRRVSPVIRNMRLLGIRANVVWKELLAALSLLIGISAIAGAGLGYALYGTVTAQVLEKEIAVSPWMMLLCVAVLAVVMLLAAAVTARVQAGKKLMSKGKKK